MIHSSLFSFFSYFFLLFNSIATKVEQLDSEVVV